MKTKLLAIASLSLALSSGAFAAASGNTSVNVNVQGQLAILSYLSNLTVNLPLTALAPTTCTAGTTAGDFSCEQSTAQTENATSAAGELSATFTAPTAPVFAVDLTDAPLVLRNVWSVRSLGGATSNAQLAITNAGSVLANGTSEIEITDAALRSTGATGTNTGLITFPDPGLINARTGDVRLNLDMSSLSATGVHSAVGAEYTLTLTNL